jgi:hypothetical protein
MPTTITSTIGTGGDYSTLQAWEDAAPANLVTSDQVWRGECFNQTFDPGGTAITFAGSTTDATRYKELTAQAGASFVDDADVRTNALRYDTANGAAIANTSNGYAAAVSVQEGFVRINRLQISSIRDCVNNGSGGGSLWLNQIIAHTSSTGGSPPVLFGRNNGKITNSLVYRTGSSTTALLSTFQTVTAVNVTLAAASDRTAATNAITQSYPSSAVYTNVAAFNCTNVFNSSSSTTSTTCRTSAASPPTGWSTVAFDTSTGAGFEGITASGFDARLKSSSALIDVGTTDSTNAALDISGTSRPQGSFYDVGAWEYGAAGPAPITATTSLSAAVQQAQSAVASISTAVQAPASASAAITAAVQQGNTATASLQAAVQLARNATASLDVAVQASGTSTASVNAALQLARTATSVLDLAVQAAGSQAASINAQIQAPSSLTASISAQVQAGSSVSLSLGAAVLAQAAATAGVDLAVQTGGAATAGISAALRQALAAVTAVDLAVQLARSAGVGINAQVQDGSTALASIDAAVQFAGQSAAAVSAAVAQAATAQLVMGAAVALQQSLQAAMAAAVLGGRTVATGLSAYIDGGGSGLFEGPVFRTTRGTSTTRVVAGTARQPIRGYQ